MSFIHLQEAVRANLAKLYSKDTRGRLYSVTVDRDRIWQEYLSGFPEEDRQSHNCSCCRRFLRQFGNAVAINPDNTVTTLWDGIDIPGYEQSVQNLNTYLHSLPITDLYLQKTQECGVASNLSTKHSLIFNHFHFVLKPVSVTRGISLDTTRSEHRTKAATLYRAAAEITPAAVTEVLDLIKEDALYRGREMTSLLNMFKDFQDTFLSIPETEEQLRRNLCWTKTDNSALCAIRNSALGTILQDLSGGMDIEAAVRRWETVMAPSNYRRPTALITTKMIQNAQEALASLGLTESLKRRFARPTDLSVENVLFMDRGISLAEGDVFSQMQKDVPVDPKKLGKVQEIGIEDFLRDVLPGSQAIELLLERRHFPNMVSLISSEDLDATPLFSWGNNFSWSYTGNVTDSIKEKVKAAGGNVNGVIRVSLSWHNYDDLDLHALTPAGHIYFAKRQVGSGTLDVDMNAGGPSTRTPVENIIWTKMPADGRYEIQVNQFSRRETDRVGYTVELEYNGQVYTVSSPTNPKVRDVVFQFSIRDGKFELLTQAEPKSTRKEDKWGISSNTFHRVSRLMLSPNHWGTQAGNRHFMFMLDGCISDEEPRPLYNEFLKPELNPHRKVFEVLGSRVKVAPSKDQLSGLGFSDTVRDHVTVRVTGTSKNLYQINF